MKRLPIGKIRRDGGTQSRETINGATVTEYSEAMQEGATFPPVTVYYDGTHYWLADGFHRLAAAAKIGNREYDVEVIQGGRRDAILHSVGANSDHGLRRTNADKRRAVSTLLRDDEWGGWSSNRIAKQCGVSHTFVDKLKSSLATDASEKPTERTYTTKYGTTATMNTENIGRTRVEPELDTEETSWQDNAEDETDDFEEIDEGGDEPLSFDAAIEDAVDDIRRYAAEVIDALASDIERHSVVNESLKWFRTLSVQYNQGAMR
jgi:hypothetical protein